MNECSTNNGGCDHICINTVGSFECSCNTGYSLTADGLTCTDTDECQLNTDNCQQTCVNTAGGFTCSCNSGYTLNGDGRTCDGELRIVGVHVLTIPTCIRTTIYFSYDFTYRIRVELIMTMFGLCQYFLYTANIIYHS